MTVSRFIRFVEYPALAAFIIATSFAIFLLQKHAWNAGALVVAGDQYVDASQVPIPVEHSAGYDGQFYYRLALNPFTNQWTEHGIRLDVPTYRQQRILFPLLAWALSFGNARVIPWMFIVINIASVTLLAWSAARLLQSSWWSIAVWMYPGWMISMSRDCAEILEVALLMSTALALHRRRRVLAAILATLAVLTKETALLGVVALAVGELAAIPLIVPLGVYTAFKFTLFRVWHASPSLGASHFTKPFAGLIQSMSAAHPMLWWIEIAALMVIAVLAMLSIRRAPLPLALAWAAYIPLIAILDESFWAEDWSFLRATSEYWVLGAAVAVMGWSRKVQSSKFKVQKKAAFEL